MPNQPENPVDTLQSQQQIKNRQHFYFLGRKEEEANNPEAAIDAYKQYSGYLQPEDQHIPHQWIGKLYAHLEDPEKEALHLMKFAEGCSDQKAAEEFKKAGQCYEEKVGDVKKALECYQKAVERSSSIGLKKKIQQLEEGQ